MDSAAEVSSGQRSLALRPRSAGASWLQAGDWSSVWPEVVFYHQSGVLGHLCGAEILAVVFSLKRVTFQF